MWMESADLPVLGSEQEAKPASLLDNLGGPLFSPKMLPAPPQAEMEAAGAEEEERDSLPRSVRLNMSREALDHLQHSPPREAVSFFVEMARRHPPRAEAWVGIAVCLLREGDLRQALPYVLEAIRVDPRFPAGEMVGCLCPGRPKEIFELARHLERAREYRHGYELLEGLARVGGVPPGQYPRYGKLGARLRRAWKGQDGSVAA